MELSANVIPAGALLLVFLTAAMLAEFGLSALTGHRQRRRAARRLREIAQRVPAPESAEAVSLLRERYGEARERARLALVGRPLAALELLLYRAGHPFGPGRFLLLSAGVAGLGVLLLSGFSASAAPLGALAGLLPFAGLAVRKRQRMRRFEAMFPEALDLLARALRAGHALSSALRMVGDELPDPVGPEFRVVAEEIQFGLDVRFALANLAHRVDVPDIPFFVTALMIHRDTGGNLAEIMDGLAHVIRERHKMYGKIRAFVAQTKWSANILLVFPYAFVGFMALFRPDYVKPLFTTQPGHMILALATLLVLAGYALCRRVGVVRV